MLMTNKGRPIWGGQKVQEDEDHILEDKHVPKEVMRYLHHIERTAYWWCQKYSAISC